MYSRRSWPWRRGRASIDPVTAAHAAGFDEPREARTEATEGRGGSETDASTLGAVAATTARMPTCACELVGRRRGRRKEPERFRECSAGVRASAQEDLGALGASSSGAWRRPTATAPSRQLESG